MKRLRALVGRLREFVEYVGGLLTTAFVWYLLLAVAGVVGISVGIAKEYGSGHGLIAFGALSLAGSEVLRRGMMRA